MMKGTNINRDDSTRPLEMNNHKALNRAISAYEAPIQIIPVLENIGNGGDAGANNIAIKLIENGGKFYLYIKNDGKPMSSIDFKKFCKAFETTKEFNNFAIGMWGVGAKLILGSEEDIEMTVVSHNTKEAINSVHFTNAYVGDERQVIMRENSEKNIDQINKVVSPNDNDNLYGTHVLIDIPRDYFVKLKKDLRSEVLRWYRPAVIQDEALMITVEDVPLESTIDEKLVKRYTEKIAGIPTTFSFYEVDDELPEGVKEQLNHTVLSCAGKVIDVIDDVSSMDRVAAEKFNKIFCIVDGTGDTNHSIKNQLTLSKEGLQDTSIAIKWKRESKRFVSNKFAEMYPIPKKDVDNTKVSNIEKKQIKKHLDEKLIPILQKIVPEDKLKELLGTPIERGGDLALRDPLGAVNSHAQDGVGITKEPENPGGIHTQSTGKKGTKSYNKKDNPKDELEAIKKPEDPNKSFAGSLIVDVQKKAFGREQDPVTGKYTEADDTENHYRLEERDQGYTLVINTNNPAHIQCEKDAQRMLAYDKRMTVHGFFDALAKDYPDINSMVSQQERCKAIEG